MRQFPMKLFNIFKLFLMISIFLCLFSACDYSNKQPIDVGDGGLLSGKPCSAPCFHHIIPGVTTEKKALETLSVELDVNDCDHWDKNNNGVDKGMNCQNFGITFNDLSVVNIVSFRPSQIITVDEVIKKFGVPDGVGIGKLGTEMQPPIKMLLYFDDESMIVQLLEQNSNNYDLQETIQVVSIGYFDQKTYSRNRIVDYPWKGFGKY
jgi:hypothetical protein